MSWATDLSPTASFSLVHGQCGARYTARTGREGVPGVWVVGGSGRGYTGYPPGPILDPYLVIFHASGHTHGQMKGISDIFMRFLRLGPRIDLELT